MIKKYFLKRLLLIYVLPFPPLAISQSHACMKQYIFSIFFNEMSGVFIAVPLVYVQVKLKRCEELSYMVMYMLIECV